MRTVSIAVHNNQQLEVFIEKREDGFELWVVGPVKGVRTQLGHHITHDDLEGNLAYAKPGDLVWRNASPSEIPEVKTKSAIEDEKTIERGTFLDFDDPKKDDMVREGALARGIPFRSQRSVTMHLKSAMMWLAKDKKELNMVKNMILGRWTDGIVTMALEPGRKLRFKCTDKSDLLCSMGHPDTWVLHEWYLDLYLSGDTRGWSGDVLNVGPQELHLRIDDRCILARVFRRKGPAPECVQEEAQPSPALPRRERVSRAAGEVSPLFTRLEDTLIGRNPLMADLLNPGLPESEIRDALSKANVQGDIEALVQLYSWANGTTTSETASLQENSIFPESIYRFMDLEEAIGTWHDLNKTIYEMFGMFTDKIFVTMYSSIKERLFPIFTDDGGGSIVVDLMPGKKNRIRLVDFEMGGPTTAYSSFSAFIKDAVRANKEDDELRAL